MREAAGVPKGASALPRVSAVLVAPGLLRGSAQSLRVPRGSRMVYVRISEAGRQIALHSQNADIWTLDSAQLFPFG